MTTKRVSLLLALLSLPSTPLTAQEAEPLFRVGLMADVQYADKDTAGLRHYRASLERLEEAIAALNEAAPAFVVQLGDLVDCGEQNLARILEVLRALKPRLYSVLGNHDFVAPRKRVVVDLKMPAAWYTFEHGGWRFVVLDGLDVSLLGEPGARRLRRANEWLESLKKRESPNAQSWNGGLGRSQLRWLEKTLAAADAKGEKAVLFCHLPAHPDSARENHLLWNHEALVTLLEKHPCVQAYINGHDHDGGYACRGGIHYLTLPAMVEAPQKNSFALLEFHPDRLVVNGRGKTPSRTLSLRASESRDSKQEKRSP